MKILVVGNRQPLFDRTVEAVPAALLDELTYQGAVPFLYVPEEETLDDALDMSDGLLIVSDQAMNPFFYQEDPLPSTLPFDRFRDAKILELVHEAIARELPIFGIGTGMHYLQVALGGKLEQDISSNVLHKAEQGTEHFITISENSWLYELFGKQSVVSSDHNQGIRELAQGLVCSARSRDGLIEAFQHESKPLFGVQFYPETTELRQYTGIIQRFIDESRRK